MNVLDVLRNLGPGEAPSPEAERRIRQRVLANIAVTMVGAPQTSPPLSDASGALTGSLLWRSKPAAMLLSWLIGGGMGAAIYGALRPAEVPGKIQEPLVQSQAPLASSQQMAPALPLGVAPSALSAPARVAVPSGPASRAAIPPGRLRGGSALAEERALLDAARAMAARGEPEAALNQAERHRTQHPGGRLAEEREALSIQALLKLGRSEEARTRARAFRESYPNSLMGAAIEPALGQ